MAASWRKRRRYFVFRFPGLRNFSSFTSISLRYTLLSIHSRVVLAWIQTTQLFHLLFFVGSSATLWDIYWLWKYGGYLGDFSPKSAFKLLFGDSNVVLINIPSEDLREKDGIPDIRWAARFRYLVNFMEEGLLFNSTRRVLIKKSCTYEVRQGCWSACFIKCLMKLKKVETQIQATFLLCYSKVDTRRSNINKMMKFLSMKVVEDDVHSKPTNMLPASVMTRLFLIMVWTMEDSLGL
ncbi:calcium sensing receptor, chloroplastic [Trifolium repens]|nr:calcium sensing receptor, chloroplastic [Trifolium repens]